MLPDRVSNPGPLTYESGALPIALRGPMVSSNMALLQISRGKKDNVGIIFVIAPVKHMLQPIIRTISPRRF